MAIRCGNDMAVVVKGSQTDLIKLILEHRAFVLVKITVDETLTPAQKRITHLGLWPSPINLVCGIRKEGALEDRSNCDFWLVLEESRTDGDRTKLWHNPHSKNVSFEVTTPTVKEFLDFMQGKELFFTTNYFADGGGYEIDLVNAFCKEVLLLRREVDNYLTDNSYPVNVFLQKVTDDKTELSDSLTPVSIKDYSIDDKLKNLFKEIVWNHSANDASDLVLEFETRDADLNAHYLLARYHSNPAWDMNPVNILNLRVAAFLLPGSLSIEEARNYPEENLTTENDGNIYKIDSIHFYSDICFDLEGFEKLLNWHLDIIAMA